MPRYEYECRGGRKGAKKHTFETRAGFNDAEILCPTCGAVAVRKGIQKVAGVIFKGGGFTRGGA